MTTFLRRILMILLTGAFVEAGIAQTREDGLAAMQLENWDKAIKVYSTLTKNDPVDQESWLLLGSAYLAKGDKDAAKKTFDAAFNAKADGPYAMIASGRILLLQGKQTEADAIFNKAEKYGRKDIVARRLIGESFLYNAPGVKPNFTRAEEQLKEAMDLSSKDFPTLMALAYCYKEMPNGGLAAQHYEYAANIEPKNPLPQFMLAKVYKAAKLNDKFLTYCDKAIALDPKYSPALRSKAEFLYFDRQWEKATQAAKDLVNNGSDVTIEDEMMLANLLYLNHDCKGCSEMVYRILQKDGSKNYLRRLLAYCKSDNGEDAEGLKILEDFFKQVEADKVLGKDYEYLAKMQVKVGRDTAVAIENYRKAIGMDSSRWPLHEEIGNLLYQQRDFCGAAVEYQKNIDSLAEPSALKFYFLGICHYYCSDDSLHYTKAEKAFERFSDLAPQSASAWSWRAKAMSKLEPDIANHPELLEEFGKAKPYFDRFVEIGEAEPDKYKRDLIIAYEYLASYYFLRNEDANVKIWLDKLVALDPENESAKNIKLYMQGETPTPPPAKGGSKGKGPNKN